jgi:sacsin
LDPQHDFTESGGVRLDIEKEYETYEDHLATFQSLFPSSDWGKAFQGTIFRLPLRTAASRISSEIVSSETISNLLEDFVREELNVTLLFLRNVTSIEIYEITDSGKRTRLATATIDRASSERHGCGDLRKVIIQTSISGSLEEREWCIFRAPFSRVEAINALKERVNCESQVPTTILTNHKLSPDVDLAIPLDCPTATKFGRLFVFQPLPLDTEFPIHINALFALTSSRPNLRNAGEKGIVKGSEDEYAIYSLWF